MYINQASSSQSEKETHVFQFLSNSARDLIDPTSVLILYLESFELLTSTMTKLLVVIGITGQQVHDPTNFSLQVH